MAGVGGVGQVWPGGTSFARRKGSLPSGAEVSGQAVGRRREWQGWCSRVACRRGRTPLAGELGRKKRRLGQRAAAEVWFWVVGVVTGEG